ncbi:ABC transporter ATP-binding protein [Methanobacterium alcaliphilum]|uniref:ABC transporter ATP-binding protein n=1 Tax=Methanobacterium alcaliphilum TaxID=392018 RepID=UPI00200B73F8|nr:ABC transporter ATP-binding protein [Methanobacterium alcaliphilum]MCK9152132.1 ABC transporter ATP-binding protein/permease [Methanobacterium alcaliphilum]
MFKELFVLTDKGANDLKKAIFSVVLADLTLMLPVFILLGLIQQLLNPLLGLGGANLNLIIYTMIAGAILLVIFLTQLYYYKKTYIAAYEESANRRIRLAEKIRKLPLSFFGKKDLAEFTGTMMDDATFLENIFSHSVPQLFGSTIAIVIIVVMLMLFDWRMGISLLIGLPVSLALLWGCGKVKDKLANKHMNNKIEVADAIQESLEGIKVIKSSNQIDNHFDKVDFKLQNFFSSAMTLELVMGLFIGGAQMALRVGIPLVILVGVDALTAGSINFIYYILFLIVAVRLYDPLTIAMMKLGEVFVLMTMIDRMDKMENQEIMTGATNLSIHDYDVELKDVSFGYNEEKVLDDVSITVKQGEVTALVGPSGSGKSTIAKLIARFWDVDEGNIVIGGKDVKDIDPETLLSHFAIVFQDVVLFNDTVLNNIKIGKKDATTEEVIAAAKLANCDDFIMNMPEGYDTEIGENGWTLSGGERQRISIARALLKDAPIILLDEATASLDVENETQIQEAITKLIKNKTLLIIAHRMRTVKGANKIVVLNKGKVIEQGSHDKLINNENLYSRLVKLQNESLGWNI